LINNKAVNVNLSDEFVEC